MPSPIVISDDEDDGGCRDNSSAFFSHAPAENKQFRFGSLGALFNYEPAQVKPEPQETPMNTLEQHTPDTGTKSQEEPQVFPEEERPAEPSDQAMPDIEAQEQGEPKLSDDKEPPMQPVDQAMSGTEGQCQGEPQVSPEEESSLFFQESENGEDERFEMQLPSAPTPKDTQRAQRFSKEPTSPQAGTHAVDFGDKISSTGQFKLSGDVSDDEDDEITDPPANVSHQDVNELHGTHTVDFGDNISSTGQFKLSGDVPGDKDDEITDPPANVSHQDANEPHGTQDANDLHGTQDDEKIEEYQEHFGDNFDQSGGEEEQGENEKDGIKDKDQLDDEDIEIGETQDENQEGQNEAEDKVDDEDIEVDPDQDEAYSSQTAPGSNAGNRDETDTDSESNSEVEGSGNTNNASSTAKGRSGGKSKAKNKDPKTAKFAQTAREYFRRLNLAKEANNNTAGSKRKGEPKNPVSAKRRKSANQTGWRNNEPCMRLAKKFLETEDLPNAANEGALPSMGSIKARTQASQFAQILAKIPKGGDTRRLASQKNDLKMAVKSFGYKRMEALDGTWRHKEMETGLFNYQVTVVSWMMERETSGSSPYGGLIGDEMGMGKTLVSLACAVGHPPEPEDIEKYCLATLVIVPNKMIARQWVDEIRKHCKEHIRNLACIYAFGEKYGIQFYKEKFFVVATYREVMHQHPGIDFVQGLKEKHEDDEYSYSREFSRAAGDLFKINWYRIILDEAHQIKNVQGHTSIACCGLSSKFSWCLSGTPLSNTPQEFFPYLKFLGCDFTDTSLNFKAKFVDGGRVAKDNFDSLVGLVMYRRTKKDSFLEHKILDLPDKHSQDIWVPQTKEEQAIYETISNHYEKAIRRIRSKEEERGYLTDSEKEELANINLARYTRLRQTVSHIFGTEPFFRESIKDDELEMLMEDFGSSCEKTKVLDHLERHQDGVTTYSSGLKKLKEQKSNVFGGILGLTNYLKVCRTEIKLRTKDSRCLICNTAEMPRDPMRSRPCGHIYCLKCLAGKLGGGGLTEMCLHPGCGKQLAMGREVELFDSFITEAKLDKKYKEPGEDANGVRVAMKGETNGFYTAAFFKPKLFMMPPSTKLTTALAVILTWQENHPDDKILVFTQFVMSGKILGYMLGQLGIHFLYLYGSVSDRNRKKAIDAFNENPEKKVMIIGLKCGGQALNLTAANRVIIIDPWWNNVQENQAFGRVWRHGQEKETHLTRIFSDTPMDKYIFELQQDKAHQVDYALQDDGHTPAVLDDYTLSKLFAPVDKEKPKETKRKSRADKPGPEYTRV